MRKTNKAFLFLKKIDKVAQQTEDR